jgi:hypothetical protein
VKEGDNEKEDVLLCNEVFLFCFNLFIIIIYLFFLCYLFPLLSVAGKVFF